MLNYPLTVKTVAGEATIPQAPRRIACLCEAFFDFFKDIDALEKVVAKTGESYDTEEEQIVSVGSAGDPDIEKILETNPDLVLAGPELLYLGRETYEKLKERLSEKEIPFLVFDPQTISDLCTDLNFLGNLVDKEKAATDLTKRLKVEAFNLKARLINLRLRKKLKKEAVFIDLGDFYAPGGPTLLNDLCEIIGVINLTGDEEEKYQPFTPLDISVADPDYYLSFVTPAKELLEDEEIAETTAAKNGKIIEVEEPMRLFGPGPKIIEGLKYLQELIYD